jgi:hypothetical protein
MNGMIESVTSVQKVRTSETVCTLECSAYCKILTRLLQDLDVSTTPLVATRMARRQQDTDL